MTKIIIGVQIGAVIAAFVWAIGEHEIIDGFNLCFAVVAGLLLGNIVGMLLMKARVICKDKGGRDC